MLFIIFILYCGYLFDIIFNNYVLIFFFLRAVEGAHGCDYLGEKVPNLLQKPV